MGLLNPFNLVWLLSVGALIAIYMRSRSRPTLEVSSLMLFDERTAPMVERGRLRIDLLFWLEAAALGALTLALAGLYMRGGGPASRVKRHALVFDLAASMGARENGSSRLADARREAMRIVASASPADQFCVIGYALEPQQLKPWSADRDGISAAIASLRPAAVALRPAALTAALMQARDADQVELFADRIPAGAAPDAMAGRIKLHQIGASDDNVAIVSLDPGTPGSRRGRCLIRNFSSRPKVCELVISADGREAMRSPLVIPPRTQSVEIFGPLMAGGLIEARILQSDALEADNRRYAWAQSNRPVRALVVSADAAVRDDLARVLLAVNENFVITAIDPAHMQSVLTDSGEPFALVAMHELDDPRIRTAARVLIFPRPGGEVVVTATLGASELQTVAVGTQDTAGGVTPAPLAHPLLLGMTRVIAPPESMEVLAQGAGPGRTGSIALAAAGRNASGRLGVIAFDVRDHLLLDPDRLDALVLVVEMLKSLAAPDGLQIVSTGSFVPIPVSGRAQVTAPDGSRFDLAAERSGIARLRPMLAGRYTIESPGHVESVYANYYDAEESDLAVKPASFRRAESGDNLGLADRMSTSRVQPLTGALLMVGLAAFLAESALLARRAWMGRGYRHV
jgi:hypothetical protein